MVTISEELGEGFGAFSKRAQRALVAAEEVAHFWKHDYLCTEHIFLGLIQTEREGANVLSSFGLDLGQVRSLVESVLALRKEHVGGETGLTTEAKKVVQLAADEAHQMRHASIRTVDLLIGVLLEDKGVAGVLESLGVTIDQVRNKT